MPLLSDVNITSKDDQTNYITLVSIYTNCDDRHNLYIEKQPLKMAIEGKVNGQK